MANNSPYLIKSSSVQIVMLKVLLALLPGIGAHIWFFGPALLVQIALASITAILAEAAVLKLRGKPVWQFVGDGSALVTAWLIALSVPPISPWWLIVVGTLAAIVIAKHLYGGLGQNPFNPAMVAFALMIVAYPLLMSQWPPAAHSSPALSIDQALSLIFGERALDAVTMATPLDAIRTALHTADPSVTVSSILSAHLGIEQAWQWMAACFFIGGLGLLQQRIITWHLPTAFLISLAAIASAANLVDPDHFNGPMFELTSGGAMLAAFFIITDPVSGCTTPRGKLIFGSGAAILTWVIRHFGAYPDGIAFAVLLMNIAAPLIDRYTQPPVFGHKRDHGHGR